LPGCWKKPHKCVLIKPNTNAKPEKFTTIAPRLTCVFGIENKKLIVTAAKKHEYII